MGSKSYVFSGDEVSDILTKAAAEKLKTVFKAPSRTIMETKSNDKEGVVSIRITVEEL